MVSTQYGWPEAFEENQFAATLGPNEARVAGSDRFGMVPCRSIDRMTRRTFRLLALLLLAVGAVVRLWNAFRFPVLASYDGFAHFTYVWYLAATRHVPLPTAGWEFFHPPLYYALMAALWHALAGVDAVRRLHVGVAIVALASLVHVAVVVDAVRRRAPDDYWLQLLAAAFTLFLPVQLYSAGFLGNEGLTAVLCSASFWLLLAYLRRPTSWRGVALGVMLGLAMLTKITALAAVVGAVATIALKAQREHRRAMVARVALVVAAIVTVSGWYYARNVVHYGTPFVMSRRELMLRLVEDSQPQARRSIAEYVLFDPLVFRRPMWPRGTAPGDTAGPWSESVRNSVWTGLYANTWFDGFGGWTVPRITESETARRAGQALLVLGIVPTLVVVLGVASAVIELRRRGWDDALVATLATLGPMLVVFVVGTRRVPIAAAVKATYLLPVTVPFGIAFALGADRLRRWWPPSRVVVTTVVAVASVVSVAVFTHGLLFDDRALQGSFPLIAASEANQYGVVYYAGGDVAAARAHFGRAARDGLYLGYENLALLAFEAGRPDEALHLLKRAWRLQPFQAFGLPADRALYERMTRAEYANLLALFEHARGRVARARAAAATAVRLDPSLPEAAYDLAVTTLEYALAGEPAASRSEALIRARALLADAVALDPGFAEARSLRARLPLRTSECTVAGGGGVLEKSAPGERRYPIETGPGAPHAASIGRRWHITNLSAPLLGATCRDPA